MALDEPTNDDEVFEADGYKFHINKNIADKINNVEIYYKYGISRSGFKVLTDINWKIEYKYEDWAKPQNAFDSTLDIKKSEKIYETHTPISSVMKY